MNLESKTLSEDILVPRRIEERQTVRLKSIQRLLQQTLIEGDLDLRDLPITDLGKLEHVRGNLDLTNTRIIDLGNLKYVEGWLDLSNVPVVSLGKLIYVGKTLLMWGTPITQMTKIQMDEIFKNVDVGWYISLGGNKKYTK